ncbi:unnamed protein product, partial [Hapterophycus canaliculatus]
KATVGNAEDDSDVKALTIALVNGRIVDATIRHVIERALEAMRQLNGEDKSGGGHAASPSAPSGWERTTQQKQKNKQRPER